MGDFPFKEFPKKYQSITSFYFCRNGYISLKPEWKMLIKNKKLFKDILPVLVVEIKGAEISIPLRDVRVNGNLYLKPFFSIDSLENKAKEEILFKEIRIYYLD